MMSAYYLYKLRLVKPESGLNPTPDEARILGSHFDYLKGKLDSGELLLAGPCTDFAFGIAIFRAESADAAQAFMDNDPAVLGGVMTAELHPFRVSLFDPDALK